LLWYILVFDDVVGVALVQEGDSQQEVYFASRVLHGVETRYQMVDKVVLALVHVTRTLSAYF